MTAHLDLSVTAPDGSVSRITVRDRDGEVVVDVDDPVVALKSMPVGRDLRALARTVGGAVGRVPADTSWAAHLPPVRVRMRGVTVAVTRRGRTRPGGAVLAAAGGLAVTALALVIAVVAGLAGPARRRRTAS